MNTSASTSLMSIAEIAERIHVLRGSRVVLDADLAAFYGSTTSRFNEQVRRNLKRFPADFMFQLEKDEFDSLRSQIATLKTGRGEHRKYLPLAFTEHGAIMAATLLNTTRATELSVHVVRAFVELRGIVASNKEVAAKVHQLERKVASHDRSIAELAETMGELLAPPPATPKRPIGFLPLDKKKPAAQAANAPNRSRRDVANAKGRD
jgi:hypothetical protein